MSKNAQLQEYSWMVAPSATMTMEAS